MKYSRIYICIKVLKGVDKMKDLKNDLFKNIDLSLDELISLRRDFHKYAESGWTEFRTGSKIAEYLEAIGLEVKVGEEVIDIDSMMGVPGREVLEEYKKRALSQGAKEKYLSLMKNGATGVVGILDTEKEGATIAFRFDIDSLEGIESEDITHRPINEGFVSINKGNMHACGHDGHAAIGLVLAKAMNNIKEQLKGKILFVFQPAEEGTRGAYSMVNKGVFNDVNYLFTGHIGFKSGKLGELVVNTGGFLSTTKLDVHYKGRSSHAGATPEKGKNALLAAATAALNLHTLCQHGDGTARINVGVLKAGTGRNVVPDRAEMKIETRGETTEINDYITQRAIKILEGAANMYDVTCEITLAGKAESGYSDKELSLLVKEASSEVPDITNTVEYTSLSGSEDATYMMNKVQQNKGKAVYLMFGTERTADHHNNGFDFNEEVLKVAVKVYMMTVLKLYEKEGN